MWIKADNYLSVEEYRQRIGYVDCRPIYKRLKRGDIAGAVLFDGRWLIPASAILTDYRITDGKSINWRRKRNRKEDDENE